MRRVFRYAAIVALAVLGACDSNILDEPLVAFPVSKDIELGAQVANEIASNPDQYPILDENTHPEAYTYLRNMLNEVLASDDIKYRDKFAYDQIKIIHDDEILNAFATPGGYIYVYTGLIKYLNTEDHLVGVLGHEIAHAERRHSIQNLQTQMGLQVLLDIVLGENQNAITDVLTNLTALTFSRTMEAEADEYSVQYLADGKYQCNGAAGFFEKIVNEGGQEPPEFLSTHPSSSSRVEDINKLADELGCDKELLAPVSYEDFKAMLP
ncbi:M48 family metalloprotease [Algivirga pacifica]|uniref:M48 family metalloprotease n=1 Tax=Algivirga pacifica TaxID=1162670 RepID=A0ABP9DBY8_9BACT